MKNRDEALALLRQHNQEEFHIRHALTVEGVMKAFARRYGEDPEYWGLVGLLHDIDFEEYPEEHCRKAPEMLEAAGFDAGFVRAVVSHGYGLCADVAPELLMEKILFAADELTGLIWAGALMRPSRSTKDMEVSSIRKKFKDKKFAAGCDREVIAQGADMLGWDLERLFSETLAAMQECEDEVNAFAE